jgi:hypothetical protein
LNPSEVKTHPFFNSIDWGGLRDMKPLFVPNPDNSMDTSYFDARNQSRNIDMQNFTTGLVSEMGQESVPSRSASINGRVSPQENQFVSPLGYASEALLAAGMNTVDRGVIHSDLNNSVILEQLRREHGSISPDSILMTHGPGQFGDRATLPNMWAGSDNVFDTFLFKNVESLESLNESSTQLQQNAEAPDEVNLDDLQRTP